MFVILVYDVNKKRVLRVNKICKKYLTAIQKSVFEGDLRKSQLDKLKSELEKSIVVTEDYICIYTFNSTRYSSKEKIGICDEYRNII